MRTSVRVTGFRRTSARVWAAPSATMTRRERCRTMGLVHAPSAHQDSGALSARPPRTQDNLATERERSRPLFVCNLIDTLARSRCTMRAPLQIAVKCYAPVAQRSGLPRCIVATQPCCIVATLMSGCAAAPDPGARCEQRVGARAQTVSHRVPPNGCQRPATIANG